MRIKQKTIKVGVQTPSLFLSKLHICFSDTDVSTETDRRNDRQRCESTPLFKSDGDLQKPREGGKIKPIVERFGINPVPYYRNGSRVTVDPYFISNSDTAEGYNNDDDDVDEDPDDDGDDTATTRRQAQRKR